MDKKTLSDLWQISATACSGGDKADRISWTISQITTNHGLSRREARNVTYNFVFYGIDP